MADNVLTQMGNAVVRKCRFRGRIAIEKQNACEIELNFYAHYAPALREQGLVTPEVYFLCWREKRLVIEFIPQSLTLEALLATPELCETLAIIHRCSLEPVGVFKKHGWGQEQTDLALRLLELSAEQESLFLRLGRCSEALFEPQQWISGDTNSGNWGRREKGQLALFDWERFGCGSPALDLAPLLKGMGDPVSIGRMVARYRQAASQWAAPTLVRHIVVAKAWLVTEVLGILHRRHPQVLPKYLAWYRATLPDWLPIALRLWRSPHC